MPSVPVSSENLAHACVRVLAEGDPFSASNASEVLIIPIGHEPESISGVRKAIGDFCTTRVGVEPYPVQLAVSEGATNALRHAKTEAGEPADAAVIALHHRGAMTLQFVDTDPLSIGRVREAVTEERDAFDPAAPLFKETGSVDDADIDAYLAALPADFDECFETIHEGRRVTADVTVQNEADTPRMEVAPIVFEEELVGKVVSVRVPTTLLPLPAVQQQSSSIDLTQAA